MTNQDAYARAAKRVNARIGFFLHLSIYVVASTLLIIMNLRAPTDYLWSKWPVIGWGIGILFHAMTTFVLFGESTLTEKMIQKEMHKRTVRGPHPHADGE